MTAVLLDIDGVLLPWDDRPTVENTGFDDWEKISARYFSSVSAQQLELIDKCFGDDIHWLTTWETVEPGANETFCPTAKFRQCKRVLPDCPSNGWAYGRNWFKLKAVAYLLATEHESVQGRVLWVDDELGYYRLDVANMLDTYNARDRFKLRYPRLVWTRDEILRDRDWLYDHAH